MIPAIQIISAYGLYVTYLWIVSKFKFLKKAFIFVCMATFLVFFAGFIEDYLYHAPIAGARSMHYGVSEVIGYANDMEGEYDEIFVSRSLSVPNIWVAFYKKWDPVEHQAASKDWLRYEDEGYLYIDQMSGYGLGKYNFGSIDIGRLDNNEKILFIGRPDEFPQNTNPVKIVSYPNGDPAYYLVEGGPLE